MYKVLIADDEQIERSTIRLILNKGIDHSLEIIEAANGRQASAEAAAQNPDIIFMDIKMPGLNGLEAAREIRSTNPDAVFVFITAYNEFEFAHEAIHIGVEDYLIKPVNEDTVISVTRKIIGKLDSRRNERLVSRNTNLKLNTLTEYLQNEFLFHLFIRGMDHEKFVEYLEVLGFGFCGGQAATVKIDFASYPISVSTDYQKSVLAKRCGSLIASLCKDRGFPCLFNYELSLPFLLILRPDRSGVGDGDCRPGADNRQFDEDGTLAQTEAGGPLDAEFLDLLAAEVKARLNISLSIHPGAPFDHARDAPGSYTRAVSSGQVEHAGPYSSDLPSADLPLQLADRFKQAMLLDDRDALKAGSEDLASWMNSYHSQPDLVAGRIGELFAILRHFLLTRRLDNQPIPEAAAPAADADLDEMKESVRNFLNAVFEYNTGDSPAMSIGPAIAHIRRHYAEDISLDTMAELSRLSPSYFSRLFKKAMGMSFVDYLTDIRIEHARYRLENETQGIAEIAENCGFRDANYFTRVFRKIMGMNPRDFRRQMISSQNSDKSAE